MNKTVVLLLGLMLSGISFRAVATATPNCNALFESEVTKELVRRTADALEKTYELREFVGGYDKLIQQRADHTYRLRSAEKVLRTAEILRPIGKTRPEPDLIEARAIHAQVAAEEQRSRVEFEAAMKEIIIDPITHFAKEADRVLTDEGFKAKALRELIEAHGEAAVANGGPVRPPDFAATKARLDVLDYVVVTAAEDLDRIPAITALLPRAPTGVWPFANPLQRLARYAFKAQNAKNVEELESSWRKIFGVARGVNLQTPTPDLPERLSSFRDFETLSEALGAIIAEATPERDLTRASFDEFIRNVIGTLRADVAATEAHAVAAEGPIEASVEPGAETPADDTTPVVGAPRETSRKTARKRGPAKPRAKKAAPRPPGDS